MSEILFTNYKIDDEKIDYCLLLKGKYMNNLIWRDMD